jgi:heme oxygenase
MENDPTGHEEVFGTRSPSSGNFDHLNTETHGFHQDLEQEWLRNLPTVSLDGYWKFNSRTV